MVDLDTEKAQALLLSTRDGGYPESESLLTAELGRDALESSIRLIGEGKRQIEVGSHISGVQSKTSC